jgi:hypothetical protein
LVIGTAAVLQSSGDADNFGYRSGSVAVSRNVGNPEISGNGGNPRHTIGFGEFNGYHDQTAFAASRLAFANARKMTMAVVRSTDPLAIPSYSAAVSSSDNASAISALNISCRVIRHAPMWCDPFNDRCVGCQT